MGPLGASILRGRICPLSLACSPPHAQSALGLFSASLSHPDPLAEWVCSEGPAPPGDGQESDGMNEPERRRQSPWESTLPASSAVPTLPRGGTVGWAPGIQSPAAQARVASRGLCWLHRGHAWQGLGPGPPARTLHLPTSNGGTLLPARPVSPRAPHLHLGFRPPRRAPCDWPVSGRPSQGRSRHLRRPRQEATGQACSGVPAPGLQECPSWGGLAYAEQPNPASPPEGLEQPAVRPCGRSPAAQLWQAPSWQIQVPSSLP